MSMEFQSLSLSADSSLFIHFESEETQTDERLESLLPEEAVFLKTSSKEYRCTFNKRPETSEKLHHLATSKFFPASKTFASHSKESTKISLFSLVQKQAEKTQVSEKGKDSFVSPQAPLQKESVKSKNEAPLIKKEEFKRESEDKIFSSTKKDLTLRKENSNAKEKTSLCEKNWSHTETLRFWEERYHKENKERGQGQHQSRQEQEQQDEKERKSLIQKIGKTDAGNQQDNGRPKPTTTPLLEKPRTGVFALFYILSKIGIFSDATSNFAYKKEIEALDLSMTEAHQERLAELRLSLKKETSTKRWGIAQKIFSWMGSVMGIIAGSVMVATGVGAVMGAMMIAAGVIQISNQILEMTGGWEKIADLLPGDDPDKKRAVISWMQIGISVLCLILSGAGIVCGGYANFGDAMQVASNMMGAIGSMGHGISSIGQGISTSDYYERFGEVKKYEKKLAELKHMREDLMGMVESGIERLEQLFEDLSRALEFEVELFHADQMINR